MFLWAHGLYAKGDRWRESWPVHVRTQSSTVLLCNRSMLDPTCTISLCMMVVRSTSGWMHHADRIGLARHNPTQGGGGKAEPRGAGNLGAPHTVHLHRRDRHPCMARKSESVDGHPRAHLSARPVLAPIDWRLHPAPRSRRPAKQIAGHARVAA